MNENNFSMCCDCIYCIYPTGCTYKENNKHIVCGGETGGNRKTMHKM